MGAAKRRSLLKRWLAWTAATVVGLQAGTLIVLQVMSEARKRGRPKPVFPHMRLEPVTVGENVLQLYSYGQDLYEDMIATIEGARESVYLETFIWKDDATGREFKERLIRKASEGVDVRVVYDSFANTVVPPSFKVFPGYVHTLAFRPFHRPWQLLDPRRYALEHRKLLVVDGCVGFLGGFNIGAAYATTWRDTHLRVAGPAAAELAQEFTDFWNAHRGGERLARRYPLRFDPLINTRGANALRLTFPIRDMYIQAIDTAQRSIRLTNAYFVPDGVLFGALLAAAERGVDVRILVPWVSNHVAVDWLTRGYFTEALRAGIRVFAFQAMLHAKTCTIDGVWSTIGTANLDRLSAVGNYEINIEVYSEGLAQQMERLFEADVTEALELTGEGWERRPWPSILGERILAPLRSLL